MMQFLPYGDQAVLINFEQKIDTQINQRVIHLFEQLSSGNIKGITFCIPAYCSLTVGFDLKIIQFEALCEQIQLLESRLSSSFSQKEKRKLNIPVCYHADFSLDQNEIQTQANLSKEEIIRIHSSPTYQVFMMGFLPGFAYLGKLPDELLCARKTTPRKKVAKGSVAIAGLQTGIYPTDSPGGWQIIGKSPAPLFQPNRKNPFLFQTGDQISFQAISKKEYFQLKKMVDSGELTDKDFYE